MAYIGVNTIGLTINVNVGFDISGGTLTLQVKTPSGTTTSKSVTVDTAALGLVHYVTVDGDLPEAGDYRIRYKWAPTGGNIYYGPAQTLSVVGF